MILYLIFSLTLSGLGFSVGLSTHSRIKVVVFGGTGFVGRSLIEKFGHTLNCNITSVSRRGKLPDENDMSVNWLAGDASDSIFMEETFSKFGPFDACVHCVGLLLDANSGLSNFNKFASGSGSIPSETSTYDRITRQTAFIAIDMLEKQNQNQSKKVPFVFVSAAEVGWKYDPPVEWLVRYLKAKRAVEDRLKNSSSIREIIFRPSLIWTWERPQALLSVLPFLIASKIGIPFIDKPIELENLVSSMAYAIKEESISGIQRVNEMDRFANLLKQKNNL